jgi:hypothetical protein
MMRAHASLLTAVVCSTIFAETALSQQLRYDELVRQQTTTINGAEDPGSIPRVSAIRALPPSIEGVELSEKDLEVLENWADEFARITEEHNAISAENYRETCAQVTAGELGARAVFSRAIALEEKHDSAVVESFDSAWSRLSPAGQVAVQEHIDNRIVPGIRSTVIDYETIAAVNEQTTTDIVAWNCRVKLTMSEEERRDVFERSESVPEEGETQRSLTSSGEIGNL